MVSEVLSSFKVWAEEKKISFSQNINMTNKTLTFDRDKIMQVLTNLISNSLKFTSKNGQITIAAQDCGDKDYVQFHVEDTGPGIAKESHKKIFQKFMQLHAHTQEKIKGTGLGLSIVEEIVACHKGKIWVESPVEEDRGSRFIFTLPRAALELPYPERLLTKQPE